jgi:hypothetical protein
MTDHFTHDPERCATCSGKRHQPGDPRPLYRLLLEWLTSIASRGSKEAP